jgi:hypothetical protein
VVKRATILSTVMVGAAMLCAVDAQAFRGGFRGGVGHFTPYGRVMVPPYSPSFMGPQICYKFHIGYSHAAVNTCLADGGTVISPLTRFGLTCMVCSPEGPRPPLGGGGRYSQ